HLRPVPQIVEESHHVNRPVKLTRIAARSTDRLSSPVSPEHNKPTAPLHPTPQPQPQTSSHHSASHQITTRESIASTQTRPPIRSPRPPGRASFPASTRASEHHSLARRAPCEFPSPACVA